MNKLYLLRQKSEYGFAIVSCDCNLAFVIRAKNARAARQMAHKAAADENRHTADFWLSPLVSSCTQLRADGETGIVIYDFCAG